MKTLPFTAMIALLTLSATSALAVSPYENLALALRQQTMINDLRTHCRVPVSIADEKIKQTFLADKSNHNALLQAADALKMGKHQHYQQLMSQITCPDFS
ncbi:hypothetical protein N172_08845 [Pantoea dispersa EGD-AAK13]|jgi:hypothetical protein|uniref:YicS family protein n=1 Tax=Pantoea TaxID=53335 RepID=UPI000395E468|nr:MULTISPECIES: YicS family protein [Pantoea]ERH62949.1 hypothetical protein N172_08845 [Pantoea dispersa EGD-AAK13]KAF0856259.1 hypothetical protein Y788_07135 [Pantoea dispersa 625]RVU72731.1 hypothetical protein EKH82_21360 [Pantoea dispersa]